MQELHYKVDGEAVRIRVAEQPEDLDAYRDFVRANLNALSIDSESTGLDIYSRNHRLRLFQAGNKNESWVLPVELGGQFAEDAQRTLLGVDKLIFQNGTHDLQVFDRHLKVPMEQMFPKLLDTKILSHLVDPRGQEEGGIGHGLEPLTAYYIDPAVAKDVKGSMTALAKKHKTTKAKIYATVDLFDPDYLLYSGMDPILAARLASKLVPMVPRESSDLVQFEHQVAEVCAYMERTGFLLDVDYTLRLSAKLTVDEEKYSEIAAKCGCENVNSTDQVADVLESRGVELTGRTPTGKRQVDKTVLAKLVAEGDEFAIAVTEAKKARKWRTTWVDTFLDTMDEHGRCHASINSLRARTARMSITGIPAQTLPSGDWIIRRCFLADPGEVIASVDYQAQELRVLAAMAGDARMIQAFKDNEDLHLLTAQAAFGPQITKVSKERKWGKGANFSRVYGGGAKTVAEQNNIPFDIADKVVKGFDAAYPKVPPYSRELANQARRDGYIITPSGRRLPVDAQRAYAALNYQVQSTSRDVTCRGLLKLHKAGFTPYLRLPVHDEVVASLPRERAQWGADRIGELMAETIGPVWVGTDPAVTGKHWGHEYMKLSDGSPDVELIERADHEIQLAGLW